MAALGPPKQRALLAILLLHVGEIVPVDRLIELLWGDDPPRTAAHSVQIYVSELRKSLEPLAGRALIHTRPPGYQLDAPSDSVDVRRFEALVRDGSSQVAAGDRDAAIATLRSALELWRGPALSDFAYEEFAQPYVRRLHDLHLDAIEVLAAAQLDVGEPGQVVALLEAAIREDPLRERSRELLMLALYRTGRHAEALRSYEKLRQALGDELGLEPSPALQQLRDRVLLHDPTLNLATQRDVAATARNPFKGLQPFGEADAQDFFGRETLVERLLGLLAADQRLIALVGPSGSGKSSIVAAGLVPRLRSGDVRGSERWRIVGVPVGPDPLADVRAALRRAVGAGVARERARGTRPETPGLAPGPMDDGGRAVLVIDHFEQVFTVPDEARRDRFLAALASELGDPASPLVVVLTLRADHYDRPLQHPAFGELFAAGVVHVLSMAARELEAAIVEPAERVGVRVETGLVAELVAETVARPGSLPLLQYGLTELFERHSSARLTHADYAALGGLRGILSRRAESVFLGLDSDEQRVATQVFLRLVRLGRGAADSRRRLTVAELTDLGIDAVDLSAVLAAFGRHRLLTFDHDPTTGEATVEMAHEALLSEWERLAGWIDRYRAALRRRDALVAAVDEWELSGRNPEYLLTGSRLVELEAWSREGSLQLTWREREYLASALERREAEIAAEKVRREAHRRLARSARMRLVAFAGAIFALVGGAAYSLVAAPPAPRAPVAYLWTSSVPIIVQAVSGFDRAVSDFGLTGRRISVDELFERLESEQGDGWAEGLAAEDARQVVLRFMQAELRRLAEDGVGLLIVTDTLPADVEEITQEHPETKFALDLAGEARNVAGLTVMEAEGSYLAGAAAALRTTTGTIGFLGGVDWEGIWEFHAGYEAGARDVDARIRVLAEYLTAPPDFGGFASEDLAHERALAMYRAGADVIFHAAGQSGFGVFDAASAFSRETGRHVWAIGVDQDQYWAVLQLPGATNARAWQRHILTSMLKRVDRLTYAVVADYAAGKFTPGSWNWGLASGAVGLSYSGGYIDDLRPEIERLKAAIIAGNVNVPCLPASRRAEAAAVGIDPEFCRH